MTTIYNLPSELLLDILNLLWREEMLKARLACKWFATTGSELFKADQVLQIHPSPESMARLLAICNDRKTAARVHEISFITPARHHDADSGDGRHLVGRTWPRSFSAGSTVSTVPELSFSAVRKQEERSFIEAYRPLLQALAKLEHLARVSVTTQSRPAALNEIDNEVLRHYELLASQPSKCFGGPGQPEMRMAKYCSGWSDMQMVFGVLSSGAVDIRELHLLHAPEHSLGHHSLKPEMFVRPGRQVDNLLANLRHAVFKLSAGSLPPAVERILEVVCKSSPLLSRLTITHDTTRETRAAGALLRYRNLVKGLRFPSLEHLELLSPGNQGFGLMHATAFAEFLSEHTSTLRKIKIENTLPLASNPVYLTDVKDKHIGAGFQIVFDALKEHARCCKIDLTLEKVVNHASTRNSFYQRAVTTVAEKVGIAEQGGKWDFSGYCTGN